MPTKNRILITGAAGGIGSVITKNLAATAEKIIAVDLDKKKLKAQFSKFKNIESLTCDLTNMDETQKLAKLCKKDKINAVIHCAGYGGPFQKVAEFSHSDWKKVFSINVECLFVILKELLPSLSKDRYGRIVAISSIQGLMGSSGSGAYVASKHALNGLIKTLAAEYGEFNISANAICPGYIQSPMGANDSKLTDYTKKVLKRTPTKKMGSALQVAKLCNFLVNESDSYLNGSIITLDGGISADVGVV